ncbi:MAG: immunoglobulin domain-containing protein, partial [Chitinispirillaceae bacterium]|nr:immunoglobulin domain-containing protein [Chitinispirillaceae bacterium]
GEDVYSGVITGLVNNTPVQVTVTATDKSQKRNSTTLTFSVTRDSTILDAEQPVIVKVAGPECGSRVKEATGSLTFTVNDNSGVDSVWWTLNDAFVAVVATSGESEYAVNYTLINYGNNVIRLFAKDKSAAGNKGSQTITLTYNTEVSALTLTAPAVNATGVSTSPTFKWSGGDDEDGDGVTYSVNYGISQASLTGTATVTGKTATPGTPLAYAKTYYWQVTATSASTAFPDKVQSAVGTFTTDGSLPTISAQPLSTSVEEGQSVAFSVTADGFGTLSYQWQKNNSPINGATSSSYKISAVPMAMNNNSYVCVVRNEVGEVTSNAAKLTVIAKYKVTYNENYGAQYVPVDDKRYGAGEEVTVKAADSRMVKDGHKFIGWCLNYNGNGTMLNTGDRFKMGSQDTVLFAQWEVIKYVVTFKNNVNNDSKNQSYDAGTSLLSNQYPSFDITGYEFSYWDKSSITVNSPTTITAYYIPTDCEASGNDIQICSGSGETYDLIITAKNSACTIMEYVWYQHHGTFEFITDGDFGGLFTAHGQSKSTLVVSNVEGVAYGFACIVKFLNGQKDTVFFPVQLCNQ